MKAKKIISGILASVMLIGNAVFPASAEPAPSYRDIMPSDIVALTAESFPDEGFRTYLSENFDLGNTGYIDCQNVTEIDISREWDDVGDIASLAGIENFTELVTLKCNYNKITKLDLSKNTKLKYLYAQANGLTSIDISKCASLETLDIIRNDLTSIDLSGCPELKSAGFFKNSLTTLDVSKNTKLTYLEFGENNVSEINVGSCKELFQLKCENNALTKLDVSACKSLVRLNVEDNKITDLNVQGCVLLENLYCQRNSLSELDVRSCASLKRLWTQGNDLAALDLSRNKALTDLNIGVTTAIHAVKDSYAESYAKSNGNTFVEVADVPDDSVEINETNFPDPIFREYVSENFDTDGDGVLSVVEVAKVEEIDVSGSRDENGNITSLKGIEYFTALTRLNCGYNKLTELDVSKNKVLEELICYSNQLTKLDASKNTVLTYLDCRSNKLIELDVSKNTALENLNCTGNKLNSIDVSSNIALKNLYCRYNGLTELDVGKNINLTRLECGTTGWIWGGIPSEEYSKNNLKILDVSKNTELTELECGNLQLTSLDVSKNTKLTILHCSLNQLTSLDVSKNTALVGLYCNDNNLTELDTSKNAALSYLDCKSNPFTKLDVSKNDKLSSLTTDKTITIYGVADTYPETYAKENNIKFIDINAPASSVTGTITVSGKDETAEDVKVSVTDADGKPCSVDIDIESGALSISGLSDGTYTLTITKSKYCPRDCTVTVADGQMTGDLSVKLQKYGDIDGTGEINITDALQIVNYRNSKTSSFDKVSGDEFKYLEKLADINKDGQVNITDALQIVNFRNGKKSSFDDIA